MPDVSMGPGMINTGWESLDEEAVCVKKGWKPPAQAVVFNSRFNW